MVYDVETASLLVNNHLLAVCVVYKLIAYVNTILYSAKCITRYNS